MERVVGKECQRERESCGNRKRRRETFSGRDAAAAVTDAEHEKLIWASRAEVSCNPWRIESDERHTTWPDADWKVFGHRSERKVILYSGASERTCARCSPHTPYHRT